MFESPFTEEETEVYTLGPSPAGRWDWGQSLPHSPVSSLLGVPGLWLSPPGKELWKDSLVKSLGTCHSVVVLVAVHSAGRWWGLGAVRVGGPDPPTPELEFCCLTPATLISQKRE